MNTGVSRDGAKEYRVFFEASGEGMIFSSPDGFVCEANAAAARLMGGDVSEVGLSFGDLIDPEDGRRVGALRELEASGVFEGQLLVRRLDGTCFTAEVTARREAFGGVAMVFRSVGERERTGGVDGVVNAAPPGNEPRFRALVHGTPDLVALVAGDGNIRYISPSVERMCGYKPEEVEGRSLFEFVHEGDRAAAMRDLSWTAQNPGTVGLQGPVVRLRHRGGGWVTVEAYVSNHMDDPHVGALVFDCRDITERVEAEERLREAEERYRLLVEQVPVATYIERNDSSSSTVYVSPRIGEMLGYAPEEWMGEPGLWLRTIHPEDHGRVLARHLRCNETGEPFEEEYRCVAKNGREVWMRDEAVLVRSESGEPLYWQGVKVDITARKLAELEIVRLNSELRGEISGYTVELRAAIESLKKTERFLEEREELLHATFERAAIGIAHVAPGGRWLRVNKKLCEILDRNREDLLGKSFQEITHPEDLDRDLVEVARLLEGETLNYSLEKRYLRGDGSVVWASLTASLVRGASGEPEYFISVIEDIGRRKRAEEILAALTPRELEILSEMSCGLTNAEIASELKFSINTIKAHVRDITRKLGVEDRTQAAVYAAGTGVFG